VAGDNDEADLIFRALYEPMSSLGLGIRATRADPGATAPSTPLADGLRARVWVDDRAPDHVEVWVWVAPDLETSPAKRSIARHDSSEVLAEEVAYAVRATLESFITRPAPPPEPAPSPASPPTAPPPPLTALPSAPPPAPPAPSATRPALLRTPSPSPVATPTQPSRFGVDVSVYGIVGGLADSVATGGGAASLDISFWGKGVWKPALWLSGSIEAPVHRTGSFTTLSIVPDTLTLGVKTTVAAYGRLRLGVAVGLGLDLFSESATTTSPGMAVPGALYLDPAIRIQPQVSVRVASWLSLIAAFDADVDLAPHAFAEGVGRQQNPLLSPWMVRPSGLLGLCAGMGGAAACVGAP
jgi:hypothetical protein